MSSSAGLSLLEIIAALHKPSILGNNISETIV